MILYGMKYVPVVDIRAVSRWCPVGQERYNEIVEICELHSSNIKYAT